MRGHTGTMGKQDEYSDGDEAPTGTVVMDPASAVASDSHVDGDNNENNNKNDKVYPYPSGWGVGEEGHIYENGFVGFLTEKQEAALAEVKTIVADEGLDLSPCRLQPHESEDHYLTRQLRARKWDVKNTMITVRANVEWHKSTNPSQFKRLSKQDILETPYADALMNQYYPSFFIDYDKLERPCTWKCFGNVAVHKILEHTTEENLLNYHLQSQEVNMDRMRKRSEETGLNVERMSMVVDADGWSIRLATRAAYSFLGKMAACDNEHYVERMGRIVVINAPRTLSIAWRIIRGWLDAETIAKISITRGRNEYEPVLNEFLSEAQIEKMHEQMSTLKAKKSWLQSSLDLSGLDSSGLDADE